jgi:hypothetical protein
MDLRGLTQRCARSQNGDDTMATATKRMNRLRHLTLALITACTAAFAQAATLDEAAAAQARGDHETAARVYGALAARGDAEAQLNLGLMQWQAAACRRISLRPSNGFIVQPSRVVPARSSTSA